jgi:CMP/dCMP kinase
LAGDWSELTFFKERTAMIITIDGPAGSGKSTVARKLAAELGIAYLDTGAMYRAITLKALRTGTSLDDTSAIAELAQDTDLQLDGRPGGTHVHMDGQDVSEEIRSLEVSGHINAISSNEQVRCALIAKQRAIASQLGSVVTEGRDQGSVVFPDADVRFLIEAEDVTRARRRHRELLDKGVTADFEGVLADVRRRDANDRRQWAPLENDASVIRVDTTHMTLLEVVETLRTHCAHVRSQS